MTINLYKYSGDRRALHKSANLTSEATLTGSLTEPSNVINPTIVVDSKKGEEDFFDPAVCNYAYIEEFNRYYFITEMTATTENIWRITMHVDVLMSYESQIAALDCYGIRTASYSKQTPDIVDAQAPFKACDWVTNYEFITFTDDDGWVLITAG